MNNHAQLLLRKYVSPHSLSSYFLPYHLTPPHSPSLFLPTMQTCFRGILFHSSNLECGKHWGVVTGHDVMSTSWNQGNDILLMHVSVSGTETHDYTKFKVQGSKSKVRRSNYHRMCLRCWYQDKTSTAHGHSTKER